MINNAISHIAAELNRHLRQSCALSEDVVVVSSFPEQGGAIAGQLDNRIVVSLVNIEKDAVPFQQQNFGAAGRSLVAAQPLYFNLYLMFASCFSGASYPEGLKLISSTISYFHGQPVFDQKNSPAMDSNIHKLIMDIENLDVQNLSNLWGVLNGRYLPSVLYKVRMVTFDSTAAAKKTAPALGPLEPSLND